MREKKIIKGYTVLSYPSKTNDYHKRLLLNDLYKTKKEAIRDLHNYSINNSWLKHIIYKINLTEDI